MRGRLPPCSLPLLNGPHDVSLFVPGAIQPSPVPLLPLEEEEEGETLAVLFSQRRHQHLSLSPWLVLSLSALKTLWPPGAKNNEWLSRLPVLSSRHRLSKARERDTPLSGFHVRNDNKDTCVCIRHEEVGNKQLTEYESRVLNLINSRQQVFLY